MGRARAWRRRSSVGGGGRPVGRSGLDVRVGRRGRKHGLLGGEGTDFPRGRPAHPAAGLTSAERSGSPSARVDREPEPIASLSRSRAQADREPKPIASPSRPPTADGRRDRPPPFCSGDARLGRFLGTLSVSRRGIARNTCVSATRKRKCYEKIPRYALKTGKPTVARGMLDLGKAPASGDHPPDGPSQNTGLAMCIPPGGGGR